MNLEPTDIAYIAAILDAEGTVTIQRQSGRKRTRTPSFQVRVMAVNSDPRLIYFLLDKVGGRAYSQLPANPKWSRMHRWQLVGPQARELLAVVRPYLILKGEVADLVMSLPQRSKGYPGSLQTDVLAEQERITSAVRVLNQRGRKVV